MNVCVFVCVTHSRHVGKSCANFFSPSLIRAFVSQWPFRMHMTFSEYFWQSEIYVKMIFDVRPCHLIAVWTELTYISTYFLILNKILRSENEQLAIHSGIIVDHQLRSNNVQYAFDWWHFNQIVFLLIWNINKTRSINHCFRRNSIRHPTALLQNDFRFVWWRQFFRHCVAEVSP